MQLRPDERPTRLCRLKSDDGFVHVLKGYSRFKLRLRGGILALRRLPVCE